MKKFILKIVVFLVTSLLVTVVINFALNSYTRSRSKFKMEKQPKSIVVGHSHPECAFNDSLIQDFNNFSNSGETYFYTYVKTKKIILNNESIENVFVEFTNNNIYKSRDSLIFNDKNINYRYPKLDAFLEKKQQEILLKNNITAYLNALSQSKKKQILRIFESDFNFIDEFGGYLYLKRFKTDSLLNNIGERKNLKEKAINSFPFSKLDLSYLRKIIEFCEKNHRKVYLIRSPQHPRNRTMKNEIAFQYILHEEFNDVEFLDFVNFPLKNSEYGDLGHLNYLGAEKFSSWVDLLLKNGLLRERDKQSFINYQME